MKIFGFIVIYILGLNAFSQEDTVKRELDSRHTISGTLGHFPGYFSSPSGKYFVNYEHKILDTKRKILGSLWATASVGYWKNLDKGNVTCYSSQIAITGLTGHYAHHFEYKVGIAPLFNKQLYEWNLEYYETQPFTEPFPEPVKKEHYEIIPTFAIGYRHQDSESGIVFRTGIGYPEIFYIGLGVNF